MEFGEMSGNESGDDEGVEMDARAIRRQVQFDDRGTPSPEDEFDGADLDNGFRPDVRPPRISGFIASHYYAQKRIAREKQEEKLRIAASTPKAIEAALKEQRERQRKRKRVKAICPNPIYLVGRFFSDPVTRFWCGCNTFCTLFIFLGSFTFMSLFYPVLLRPTFKY